MFFKYNCGAKVVATLFCSLLGAGCATVPAPQTDNSRVSLGVQLVRTPSEVTRSVSPEKAQPWRPAIGDPDDVDVDEQEELSETLARRIEPTTRSVVRKDTDQGASIFSEGDVDAESGVD